MNKELYDMIFKRKSFHLFRNIGNEHITEEELKDIEEEFYKLKPLVDGINVKIKIVKDKTTCNRGQEYCILFYSERKDNRYNKSIKKEICDHISLFVQILKTSYDLLANIL